MEILVISFEFFSKTMCTNNGIIIGKCPSRCDTSRNLVCGDDGNTYLNHCLLKKTSCQTKKKIKKTVCGEHFILTAFVRLSASLLIFA